MIERDDELERSIDDDPEQPSGGLHDLHRPRKVRARGTRAGVDPDHDVVHWFRQGDRDEALRELMARHGGAVYRYCHEELRDGALAEDVLQQVFIEAFRDLTTFEGRSTVRTWLFAIARHRVLDAAKARARMHARIETDSLADAPDRHPSPGELLDDARLLQAIDDCIAEFDDKIRTALLLRYQQGFTYDQMAVICGEKPGTLQVRVARSLRLLRARLRLRTGGAF